MKTKTIENQFASSQSKAFSASSPSFTSLIENHFASNQENQRHFLPTVYIYLAY